MRPTLRAVLLFVAGLGLAVLPTVLVPGFWVVWLAWLAITLLALGVDSALSIAPRKLHAAFAAPTSLMIGHEGTLSTTIETPPGATHVAAEVLFELGPLMQEVHTHHIALGGDGTAMLDVRLRPLRRGTAVLEHAWLRWAGPLGLISRKTRVPIEIDVAIVPNVAAVRSVALKYFTPSEHASGLKVERYVGDGSEFESLREYVPGLDARAINWRATARHRRLICQDFRAERNHQVVLAIDTGHLMSEPIGGIPKLDHAISAGLVLAYMALNTGDRVGLFGFDAATRSYAEPHGGVHAFPRLRHLTADLDYTTEETNFTLGLADLASRLRRRSLIVLMTDFVDTVTAELMLENLDRLARRHLVIFVTLRDPHLEQIAGNEPHSLSAMYESVVANEFVRERELVMKRLQRKGVLCVDVAPEHVTASLLNHYLEVKRREMV